MPLLVVALAWLAQGAVLKNGWVWDDTILIRDGKTVARGLSAVPELMTGSWGRGEGIERGLYRPLVSASLAVQASLHGGTKNPFPFHLANLCLHGIAAVLVLAVCSRLAPSRPVVSSTAAILFAIHPLHTGTVSWIVARGDLLATVFSLLCVLAWTRPKGLDVAAAVLAGLAWLLALLSKESALSLPLALLLVDAGLRHEGLRAAVARRWHGWAVLALAGGAWLAMRLSAGGFGSLAANAPLAGNSILERLFVAAACLVRMAWKIALPVGLTGDASNDPLLVRSAQLPTAYLVCTAALLVVVVVLKVRARRGGAGLVTFCLSAFAILALPAIQLVPIGAVFEDRFAYLPSVALLPIAGLAAERVLASRAPKIALAGMAVVVAALVAAAWTVAADWRDEEAFDKALLADDPAHFKAADRLGTHWLHEARRARLAAESLPMPAGEKKRDELLARRASLVSEAVTLLETTTSLPGGYKNQAIQLGLADAYANLPEARHADAQRTYEHWLDIKRVLVGGHRERVFDVTDPSRVVREDRREVSRVYDALARESVALHVDDHVATAGYLEQAARWDEQSFDLAKRAGAAWIEAQDLSKAFGHIERAVSISERDARVSPEDRAWAVSTLADLRTKTTLGTGAFERALAASRRVNGRREALALFEQAVAEKPELIDAYFEIAKIRAADGAFQWAFEALDAAVGALDRLKAPADDPRRARVAALRTLYEKRRDEPTDPIREDIDAAKFANSRPGGLDQALKNLAAAREKLDAAGASADDPRRAEIDALEKEFRSR